jgi:hypothetical protein
MLGRRSFSCVAHAFPVSSQPELQDDLQRCGDQQRAQRCFSNDLHRPLDKDRMSDRASDDHRHQDSVRQSPCSWAETKAFPERHHQRDNENCPHRDHAPMRERCRRVEHKRVDHVWRARHVKPDDMEDDRSDDASANPLMCSPRLISRKARQIPANQERLHKHQRHGNDACEATTYVDRASVGEQRTVCGRDYRHDHCGADGQPDQIFA